jgi:ATPases with chaperone activity, ATP-binding subunit
MLTTGLQELIDTAYSLAIAQGIRMITADLVVLACMDCPEVRTSIGEVTAREIENDLRKAVLADSDHSMSMAPICSPDVTAILTFASKYAKERGFRAVSPAMFVRAAVFQGFGKARGIFTQHGVSIESLDASIAEHERVKEIACHRVPDALARFCTDLVAEAAGGRLSPVYGREEQVARIGEILQRKKKNNPMLIGEPGVGKTAIVEGFAVDVIRGHVAPGLEGTRILALNVAALMGGTRNRGDLEERLNDMIQALEANPHCVLFIDEIHVLVGGLSGFADAANILKPALASGRIRCIGATTHGEYAKYFDSDPALARRFLTVDVPEPTPAEAMTILERVAEDYGRHHRVAYDPSAVRAAVDLSVKHLLTRRLPDKAIDILDEAGVMVSTAGMEKVTQRHVEAIVSRMCGRDISGDGPGREAIRSTLCSIVRGQDDACDRVAAVLARSGGRFAKAEGARAAILLHGASGTGKSLMAAAIGKALGLPVRTLDMREFRFDHTVSRLIGSPPGYVGHGTGGILTEMARREPACVILLDRLEMAHPDVISIIAQAIERGVLTDTSGRIVSFGGVIFVMTTGEDSANRRMIGFSRKPEETFGSPPKEIAPDFLASLDLVVELRPLSRDALLQIAKDHVRDLADRLGRERITLSVDDTLIEEVVDEVQAAGSGARAMRSVFRRIIEDPVLERAGAVAIGDGASIVASSTGVHAWSVHEQAMIPA